ncbi:Basic amino-acid permease [Orbilia oligospora]|uniref:Basic amino-acid permease n=1 Tax=Orbilia oligospora TaxID=2813651 RepID=A0A7C8IY52_ORBOL|nr:Basic amino-acid permease [Orbilia oligospora]KAF3106545.1 Basic amino-acid permease [Orbilia oligospora]KAF3132638.1 Basic amino-acid permease [Orbilia oligospora]KAF3132826.1 Basic amino-acid permease [Orbilia oligospora]
MHIFINLYFLGLLVPLVSSIPIDQPQTQASEKVERDYIIVLKNNISKRELLSHTVWAREINARFLRKRQDSGLVQGIEPAGVKKVFDIYKFKAYSGTFDSETLNEINRHKQVDYIEKASPIFLNEFKTDLTDEWGLLGISHKVSQFPTELNGTYRYDDSAGEGMFAYVVDSGVNIAHKDFEGRAEIGYDALHPDSKTHNDTHGHGTHTAGTIASKTYGVAKKARVISVKVIDRVEYKRNTSADLLDGINWAANDIVKKNRQNFAVINLSMAISYSRAINDAIDNAYKMGVLSIVAAGNNNMDIREENSSPTIASKAFVVGAIGANNRRWVDNDRIGSNYGDMVDIMAPGENIMSLGIENNIDATSLKSGTSMAAPHVAGLACYLRRLEGLKSPEEVTSRLLQIAQKDVLDGESLKGSPNLLAYNGNGL